MSFRIPLPHMGVEQVPFLCAAFPVTDCRISQKEGIFYVQTHRNVPCPLRHPGMLCRIAVMTALYLPLAWLAIRARQRPSSPLRSLPVMVVALLSGPVEADADRRLSGEFLKQMLVLRRHRHHGCCG